MPTITDETYFGHTAEHPLFVVRGNDRHGQRVREEFTTRAAAERFRDRTWPKAMSRAQAPPAPTRDVADFPADLRRMIDGGATMHFSGGAKYMGSVHQVRGGYAIARPGLPAPVTVRWGAVRTFITGATHASDQAPR